MTTPIDYRTAGANELPLTEGVWKVDPACSEVGFAVKNFYGLQTVRGVFRTYDGTLNVRAGAAAGELTIEAASLDTRNRRRDKHLRSSDFFDVERHPRIAFAARAVTAHDGGLAVSGELAIRSARVPLEIPMSVERVGDGVVRLEGKTSIPREAAGLTWNWAGTIGRDAVLHARLTVERAVP